MRVVIAALVAVSLAIFPIATAPAAGIGIDGGRHGLAGLEHHDNAAAGLDDFHHGKVGASHACDAGEPAASSPAGDPAADAQCAAVCCGGMACHFFQVSSVPPISAPPAEPSGLAVPGEEQLAGTVPDQLDRPPRTV